MAVGIPSPTHAVELDLDAKVWLEQFPVERRSALANFFHDAVRSGASTPAGVLNHVRRGCESRLRRGDERGDFLRGVVASMTGADRPNAWRYAAYVIEYEALPRPEREKIKAEARTPFVLASMAGKPSTPAQCDYLLKLGHTEAVTDRKEAHDLIDQLLARRDQ